MVLTAAGLVAIEKIKAGDVVISTNPDTLETAEKPVLETYVRQVNTLVHLTINGEEIVTTDNHPFYVQGRGFIEADKLLVGDKLISVNGEDLVIEEFFIEETAEPVDVYNFQVEDYHTYFVGGNKVWVHNANYPKDPNKLLDHGWEDSTPDGMKNNTKSKEFTNPKTGDKVRFDPAEEGASGYAGKDHYHQYNPNSTGKSDYYLDANGNPVPKNSKASHILPEE